MDTLANLTSLLSELPGVGEKTATRLAFFLLKQDQKYLSALGGCIKDCKELTKACSKCFSYTEDEVCKVCAKTDSRANSICVVANSQVMQTIEKAGVFTGTYHVLQGLISPMDGIGPDQIRARELLLRCSPDRPSEIIFALDTTIESEATILYLTRLISPLQIPLSRIGFGLGVGSDISSADAMSLGKALSHREHLN